VAVFTEQDEQVARPRGLLRWVTRQMRREHALVLGLARQLGTTWKTVWRGVRSSRYSSWVRRILHRFRATPWTVHQTLVADPVYGDPAGRGPACEPFGFGAGAVVPVAGGGTGPGWACAEASLGNSPGSVTATFWCWCSVSGVAVFRVALRGGSPGGARSWVGGGEAGASGPQRGEPAECGEYGEDVLGPGPGRREPEPALSGVVGQSGRDVQQPVPQRFRLTRLQGGRQGKET